MKFQYFNSIKFTLDERSGYYCNSTIHTSIHRYVWSYYNGDIPEGFEIHHIDFDKSNNDITNLLCIACQDHKKLHGSLLTGEQRDVLRHNLKTKALPKAVEWHKSEKGLEWHRNQVKTRKDNRKIYTNICKECGIKFVSYSSNKGRNFCTPACAKRYERKNKLYTVTKLCEICGNEFTTDKYRPSRTCSRSCSNKLKWLINPNMGKKKSS